MKQPRESSDDPYVETPMQFVPGLKATSRKSNDGSFDDLAEDGFEQGLKVSARESSAMTYGHVGEPDPETCEHAGHEWAPAGGGLLICMCCEAEKWEED